MFWPGIAIVGAVAIGLNLYTVWKARRAEAAYPPLGRFVIVEGTRLHYVRKGCGPAVVLLHGSDGSLQDFTLTILDRLAQEYDVLAFDRPGHGYSEAPRNEVPTLRVQARLIHAALRQLGVEKPVLVGHSWGGALALVYALEYPQEVAGLTLLAGWVYPADPPHALLLTLLQTPLLGRLGVSTLLGILKGPILRRNLEQAFTPAPVPEAYAGMAAALWQRWPWQTRVFAQENTTAKPILSDLAPRYPEIRVPIRIVTGEADGVVAPAQHAYRLHEAIPHSELIRLPDTGHELAQTRPEAVIEAVRCCHERAALAMNSDETVASPVETSESDPEPCAQEEVTVQARELVFRYGWNATAYQILNPDMEHWFSAEGDAVVGFVRRGKVRVAAGAPICPEDRLTAVTQEFEQAAAQEGERVCFFGASARLRNALPESPPHSDIVIGAQPIWEPKRWPDMIARHASLRAQLNRARNKGVSVSEWPRERAHNHPDLQRCLEEWLATRPLPTLRFLTEPVALNRLADRRVFVAEANAHPVGFLIATPVPDRHGWLIEQIVRGAKAPNGTAEAMVDAAMRALAADGYDYVTLGLAPLSRRAALPSDGSLPGLRLLLAWVRAHGRRFYNFDGLDAFKAKFRPDAWEPLFAISNEPRFSFRTLFAIAAAFSNGPLLAAIARAFAAALRQELRWIRQRLRPA